MTLFSRWSLLVGLSAIFVLSVGCQEPKYYPVRGQLLDETGAPFTELAGAPVSFESETANVSAVAEVQADGSFVMTTETPEDGCLPGLHRVAIGRVYLAADAPSPRYIDSKYESFETSGLKFEVEKKMDNFKEFKLPRLKQ